MRTNLSMFRAMGRAEEALLRAVMPRTSANDPTPLPLFAAPRADEIVNRKVGSRIMRPAGWTLAEVAHA